MILAPTQMSLLSIFHRRFHDRFFLRQLVITWLDTASEEAWAQGQISRYPGWYSQLMYITTEYSNLVRCLSPSRHLAIPLVDRDNGARRQLTQGMG